MLTSLTVFSQVKVGFELGGSALRNLDSISHTNKTLSFGGEVGLNVEFPIVKNKISFETGLLFYDTYYRSKGPHVTIIITEALWSGIKQNTKINDLGFKIPFRFIVQTNNIKPFVGIDLSKSISGNRFFEKGLYSAGVKDIHASGIYSVQLSPYTLNICGGFYYIHSPSVKYRLQYSMGMNNFVEYTFTERIINGVVIDPVYSESTRMHQLNVALVYTPKWEKNKSETIKIEKPPLKERLKQIYQ